MLQVGLRGTGASRRREVDDARGFGSLLVGAEEVHRHGVEPALDRLPRADAYYISIDITALDPSIAPGVERPAFGGLTYFEATNLLKGVAAAGRVAGCDLTGIVPSRDVNGMTGRLGVRLVLNLLGAMAHSGQFERVTRESPGEVLRPSLLNRETAKSGVR
jgi:agmatinase